MARLPLIVPPMTLSPAAFPTGHRLAGDHRFIDRSFAVDDLAIGRDFFIRFDTKRLSDVNMPQVDHLLPIPSSWTNVAVSGASRSSSLIADRGLRAGSEFQNLSEQNERRDHRRRFEISGDKTGVGIDRIDCGKEFGDEQGGKTQ